ncbi:hypothetical protein ACES2L_11165 [Bdellovibrio bacteriovorus]
MYSRSIFTVLISAILVLLTTAFTFQVKTPFYSGGDAQSQLAVANVLQAVEGQLNGLHKTVHARLPASEKVEKLKGTLSSIEELRKQNPLQTVDKEVYMDYATESLQHVAQDPQFSKEKCPEYKARVMINFEPYSEHSPSHPALKRSYQIIEGICS